MRPWCLWTRTAQAGHSNQIGLLRRGLADQVIHSSYAIGQLGLTPFKRHLAEFNDMKRLSASYCRRVRAWRIERTVMETPVFPLWRKKFQAKLRSSLRILGPAFASIQTPPSG